MKALFFALIVALLPTIAVTATSHTEAIEKRQAAFKEIKAAVAEVNDARKAKDFAAAEMAAQSIANNAKLLPDLFPEGSYEGDTRAKEKIWKNLDDFQKRQQSLITNSEALVKVAQGDDAKELKKAFKTMSKDCKGCHMKYRQVF